MNIGETYRVYATHRGKETGTMREIKFRGKRIDNGEWVYGCLTRYSDHISYIVVDVTENNGTYQVLTETVGQYTGLKDRNGREIYKGDVLRLVLVDYAHVPEQIFVVGLNNSDSFFEDVYLQHISRFVEDSGSETDGIEVIGNIYEHPHLLKGDGNE